MPSKEIIGRHLIGFELLLQNDDLLPVADLLLLDMFVL
jgi:hypothetical protein